MANSASGLSVSSPTVVGQYTVVPQSSVPSGASPLPSVVTATVALKPSGDLQGFLNELNNPNNPEYRKFLTLDAVGAAYGSTSYAAAVNYFQSYGLTVQLSSGLLTLSISGSPAQMGAAFHTTLTAFATEYQSQGVWNPLYGNESAVAGSTTYGAGFYANTEPLSLPASLTGVVEGVAGLAGLAAQPSISAPLHYGPGQDLQSLLASFASTHNKTQDPTPEQVSGTGYTMDQIQGLAGANFTWAPGQPYSFDCEYYGFGCSSTQTLYPSTMHMLNGAENLWSGATTISSEPDMGQGITIALIEVGCLDTGTVQQFSNEVWTNSSQPGLPLTDRLTQIAVNTGHGFFPNTNLDDCILNGEFAGWTVETALDAEYASTMAPLAHIDIVGIPYPGYFSDFDQAYGLIAQDLSLVSTGGVCPEGALLAPTDGVGQIGLYLVGGSTAGACSVTITSNSYGEGEWYASQFGSPMYITVEDTELEELNAVGVTNFFASGDDSGAEYDAANQAGMPAASPGSTSVGGGMTTAESQGQVYPVTSSYMCPSGMEFYGVDDWGNSWCVYAWAVEDGIITSPDDCFYFGADYGYCAAPEYVAPAMGLESFTYWDYGFGIVGTYMGAEGGAFGQSTMHSQPWWQNGLDTYSTGASMDPIVSFEAAFNMTIYDQMYGGWLTGYGGTSFATPTTAGAWALIEEQADVAYGDPAMGDINPILFAAHNAFEAKVSSFAADPYVVMTNMGFGFDWGPINSYNWYYGNLSINHPYDPLLPWWFNTLFNPAGPGWNYLQGLGLIQIDVMDQELLGETGLPGHSLTNPAFAVVMVTGGGLVPLPNTLLAGTTYNLEVVSLTGGTSVYNVAAYSGQSNAGAYGGGTVTTLQTSSGGTFSYTPTTGTPPGGSAATTYGYILVTTVAGTDWSFVDFAVASPASGTLSLCVLNPQGVCASGSAEVTTFTTDNTGYYNLFQEAFVTLNGLPVASAVVSEVAVNVAVFQYEDPTMPLSSYAPGALLGNFLTGSSGDANFWTDAYVSEINGTLPTQVVDLTASYGGLTSNMVTVFIEPQTGSYDTSNLALNTGGTAVVGTLTFSNMFDVNFINVSIGSAPGQYLNTTYPPVFYDSNSGLWVSGVSAGQISVDLSTSGLTGPIQVSIVGMGTNDLSFEECFSGYCYSTPSVQNPIIWADPLTFLPGSVSLSATGTVTGTDTVTWTGTAYTGAVGTVSLVSGAATTVLATGISGTYALDTTTLLDGYYSVVFTETAPGAQTSTYSESFYADNQAASANALIAQLQAELSTDATTIASLSAQVVSLQASLSAANASIASLQSQVTTLQGQVSTLHGQLAAAQAQVTSLQEQVATLSANASEVATLKAQLATAQGQVSSDLTQIASLTAEVQSLQNELNAKKNYVAPAWYTSLGSGGVILLIGVAAALVGLAAYFGGRHSGRKSKVSVPAENTPRSVPAEPEKTLTTAVPATSASSPEATVGPAPAMVAALPPEAEYEPKLEPATSISTRGAEAVLERGEFDRMYR